MHEIPLGLCGGHNDLDQMRVFEIDPETGAHWRIGLIHPFVPGLVHVLFAGDIGDIADKIWLLSVPDKARLSSIRRSALRVCS
jgi:hypothetical protein